MSYSTYAILVKEYKYLLRCANNLEDPDKDMYKEDPKERWDKLVSILKNELFRYELVDET